MEAARLSGRRGSSSASASFPSLLPWASPSTCYTRLPTIFQMFSHKASPRDGPWGRRGEWTKGCWGYSWLLSRPLAGSRLSHPESPLSLPTVHSFIHTVSSGHLPGIPQAVVKGVVALSPSQLEGTGLRPWSPGGTGDGGMVSWDGVDAF